MTYTILSLTDDPRQVFSLSVSPDGIPQTFPKAGIK